MTVLRRQLGLEPRNGIRQSLGFARDIAVGNRRIQTSQLGNERLARAIVNRAPDFGRRIRQTGNGLGKKRIIFSHFLF